MPTLYLLSFVAGLPIAPTIGALYALIDRSARKGTAAEAFAWFGTAVSVGIATGSPHRAPPSTTTACAGRSGSGPPWRSSARSWPGRVGPRFVQRLPRASTVRASVYPAHRSARSSGDRAAGTSIRGSQVRIRRHGSPCNSGHLSGTRRWAAAKSASRADFLSETARFCYPNQVTIVPVSASYVWRFVGGLDGTDRARRPRPQRPPRPRQGQLRGAPLARGNRHDACSGWRIVSRYRGVPLLRRARKTRWRPHPEQA